MPPKQSFWFHLGYALERARNVPPNAAEKVRVSKDRASAKTQDAPGDVHITWPSLEDLAIPGAVAALAKLLRDWKPRRRTPLGGLVRAGVAGAVAALVVDLLRPMVRGPGASTLDKETGYRLLAGIRQGLFYGAILEPKVPGPIVLKGALYGTVEYAANPVGGLSQLLGAHTPQHRLSVLENLLENLLEDLDSHDRSYMEHVVFGVVLALLYGSSTSSNRILLEEDDG